MERKESPKQQFDKAAAHYYAVLKAAFINDVNNASNKLYAYEHCKKIYFERNEFIPYTSAHFHNLKAAFVHYFNMNEETSIDETLKCLPMIKGFSREKIEQCTSGDLPELYQDFLEEEDFSLEEILEIERRTLESDDENTIAVLALYHSTRLLLRDLPEFYPLKQISDVEHQHTFTRSQQVLFAHYLFKLAGINQIDNASLAKIIHGVIGLPYNEIKNSEIYKKLCGIYKSDKKNYLPDLKLVRSYFEKLDRADVLAMIDKEINSLK